MNPIWLSVVPAVAFISLSATDLMLIRLLRPSARTNADKAEHREYSLGMTQVPLKQKTTANAIFEVQGQHPTGDHLRILMKKAYISFSMMCCFVVHCHTCSPRLKYTNYRRLG